MSLENRLKNVIHDIYNLFDWLGMACTLNYSRVECLNHSLFDPRSSSGLRSTQPSRRLSQIRGAFLLPHPTVHTPHLPFRSFTGLVDIPLPGPLWENQNHRVSRQGRCLGDRRANHHGQFQTFHMHDDLRSQNRGLLRRWYGVHLQLDHGHSEAVPEPCTSCPGNSGLSRRLHPLLHSPSAFNNRVGYPDRGACPHFHLEVACGRHCHSSKGRYLACGLSDGSFEVGRLPMIWKELQSGPVC